MLIPFQHTFIYVTNLSPNIFLVSYYLPIHYFDFLLLHRLFSSTVLIFRSSSGYSSSKSILKWNRHQASSTLKHSTQHYFLLFMPLKTPLTLLPCTTLLSNFCFPITNFTEQCSETSCHPQLLDFHHSYKHFTRLGQFSFKYENFVSTYIQP